MYKSNQKIKIHPKPDFRKIPEEPGIYIYSADDASSLYVGKAKNLRSRLRSYFRENLLEKTSKMMAQAKFLTFIKVTSELEALLLEAKLVRRLNPYFNSALKDDKHPLYIKITKEIYPRVITVRKSNQEPTKYLYGPFPSSETVYSVLKMLRRIFPYSQHKLAKKPCLYKQMGLCNPCPNEIEKVSDKKLKNYLKRRYLGNISSIKQVLDGKFSFVIKNLTRRMENYSNSDQYELAKYVRDQIKKLKYLTQPVTNVESYLLNPNLAEDIEAEQSHKLAQILSKYFRLGNLSRIECYDVSHLAGVSPTASMVTFINAVPAKEYYRHFRIYQKKPKSDTDSLTEVARRRLKYLSAWGIPDLIVIDGGKAQVSSFSKVFYKTGIPIVGIAKRYETLVIPHNSKFAEVRPGGPALYLVQKLRDEAHRFAISYHHKLVTRSLLGE